MNDPKHQHASESLNPEMFDLMIQRGTRGLEPEEAAELQRAEVEFPGEAERIELTLAAADLAMLPVDCLAAANHSGSANELPQALRSLVQQQAEELFASGTFASRSLASLESAVREAPADATPHGSLQTASPRDVAPITLREILSMTIAAACLVMVFSGYNPLRNGDASPSVLLAVAETRSAAEQLQLFLDDAPADLVQLDWTPVAFEKAKGEILWSDQRQAGFMVFESREGIFNDPDQEQYQLWIFDTDPDQEFPVDGGVFDLTEADIATDGRIIVPIDAKIRVDRAVKFAVTIEKPGGVVVSKQERIPVFAVLDLAAAE